VEFTRLGYGSTSETQDIQDRTAGHLAGRANLASVDRSNFGIVWKWLTDVSDISVGPKRKWNHLGLDVILSLPGDGADGDLENAQQTDPPAEASEGRATPAKAQTNGGLHILDRPKRLPARRPRVYVTEERTWELVAGHGPDYKRIPRLEWLALLGIASARTSGILQGDLGRLVSQDKRSLPRRTDSLARKGYITKKLALARGSRTSKLWLKHFTPPEVHNDSGGGVEGRLGGGAIPKRAPELHMSRDILVGSLEAVPWHSRWTGDTIDAITLGQTILAIVKACDTIRYHELRVKLGISGLQWQQKVAARTCRYLVRQGAIRYVAAVLDGRVFKDCIKHHRDLTPEEWLCYGQVGSKLRNSSKMEHSRPSASHETAGGPSIATHDESWRSEDASHSLSTTMWTPNRPLINSVFEAAQSAGTRGVTNRQICDATMGSTFSRFISSLTTAISDPKVQPPHLAHFKIEKSLRREGRSVSNQFNAGAANGTSAKATSSQSREAPENHPNASQTGVSAADAYGFRDDAPALNPRSGLSSLSLTGINDLPATHRPKRGRPPKILFQKADTTGGPDPFPAGPDSNLTNGQESETIVTVMKRSRGRPPGSKKRKAAAMEDAEPTSANQVVNLETNAGSEEVLPKSTIYVKEPAGNVSALAKRIGVTICRDAAAGSRTRSGPVTRSLVATFNIRLPLSPEMLTMLSVARPTLHSEEPIDHNTEGLETSSLLVQMSDIQVEKALLFEVSYMAAPANDAAAEDPRSNAVDNGKPTKKASHKSGRSSKANAKPYRCEKCGGAWKNDLGLKYHLEKSQTTCNSNYDAEAVRDRKREKLRHDNEDNVDMAQDAAPGVPGATLDQAESRMRNASDVQGMSAHGIDRIRNKPVGRGGVALAGGTRRRTLPRHLQQTSHRCELFASYDSANGLASEDLTRTALHHEAEDRGLNGGLIEGHAVLALRDIPKDQRIQSDTVGREQTSQRQAKPSRCSSMFEIDPLHQDPTRRRGSFRGAKHGTPSGSLTHSAKAANAGTGPTQEDGSSPYEMAHDQTARNVLAPSTIKAVSILLDDESSVIVPGFRMPPPGPNKLTSQSAHNLRVSEIINYLVTSNGGSFPGDKSLWLGVQGVWERAFPQESLPEVRRCELALAKLVDQKQLHETTYAFRSKSGTFARCQVVMLAGVDPFSSLPLSIKDKLKDAYPEHYLPPQFALPQHNMPSTHDDQIIKSRRRKLTGKIEVLQAPFYANQAWKRKRHSEANELESPSKRARTTTAGNPRVTQKHRERRPRGLGPVEAQDTAAHSQWDILSFCSQNTLTGSWSSFRPLEQWEPSTSAKPTKARVNRFRNTSFTDQRHRAKRSPIVGKAHDSIVQFVSEVKFLDPNTFLGEEGPDGAPIREPMPPGAAPSAPSATLEIPDSAPIFLDNAVIKGSKGIWPKLGLRYFEKEESFRLQGWMPNMTWFLLQKVPRNLDQMIARKRPRSQGSSDGSTPNHYDIFLEQVEGCVNWELSGQGQLCSSLGGVQPNYIFVNLGSKKDVSLDCRVKPLTWDSAYQLSQASWIEDEPEASESFSSSTSSDTGPVRARRFPSYVIPRGRGGRPRGRPRKARRTTRSSYIPTSSRPAGKTRTLSSWPKVRRNDQRYRGPVDRSTEDRVIAAFVAVRALLGGVNKYIDWGMIMRILPDVSLHAARRFWTLVAKQRRAHIRDLTERFQANFIEAYEKGELPEFDFDKVLDYDWQKLINWTLQLPGADGVSLPRKRTEVREKFGIKNPQDTIPDWRDTFYGSTTSVFARFEAATSLPSAQELEAVTKTRDPAEIEFAVAKSWIRALCFTDDHRYTPRQIHGKILALVRGDEEGLIDLLRRVVDTLQDQKIISKSKAKPLGGGRQYRLNESFNNALEKFAQDPKYVGAMAFKDQLDRCFRRRERFEIPYATEDGMMMAILNLQASRRVDIVPVDIPDCPLGFEPGNYENRKFPKSHYHFRLQVVPTPAYIYNDSLEILTKASREKVPMDGPNGEYPLWSDFFGDFSRDRWSQAVSMICFALANRGSMDAANTAAALKPVMEEFEIQMVMDWGMRVGLFESYVHGAGLVLSEWWWLVAPKLRTTNPSRVPLPSSRTLAVQRGR
jgi:hypothetical protein